MLRYPDFGGRHDPLDWAFKTTAEVFKIGRILVVFVADKNWRVPAVVLQTKEFS